MIDSYGSYFIAACAAAISLFIIYVKWSYNYWKNRDVPYLKPSFPFGNFVNPIQNTKSQAMYFKDFYNEFKKMGKKYGGVYTFLTPTFITVDPELNKDILVKHFQNFHDRGITSNEKVQPVAANLFNMDGERWKSHRTKLTPSFTSAKMKQMFNLMTACSSVMTKYVEQYADKKAPIDIKNCVSRLTTDVIASCAFGLECNSFQDTKFQRSLMAIFQSVGFAKVIFANTFPFLTELFRIKLFPAGPVNRVVESIDKTIKMRQENNITRNDLLQILLEMNKKGTINMDEIRGQCLLFFLGGYETSANTMTFTLFELARNQDIQKKVRKEIHDVLAKYDNVLTYEALQDMKYLQMVIDETLRKYPPMPFLFRKCVEDFPIPNSNTVIVKDTPISIPLLGLHYDPEYFPNPEKYDPDRFTEENKRNIVPYTYLPFGVGPRNCIGDRFAKLQVRVGLISIINTFNVTLNSEMKLPLEYTTELVLVSKQPILLDIQSVN